MRATRVLHVHKDFEPLQGGGGTARHIHGLAKALSSKGCSVRVASPDAEPISGAYEAVCAKKPTTLSKHVRWADVVHVHGARSKYALLTAFLAAFHRKPFIYTPHAYYDPHGFANKAAKIVWDQTAERFLLTRASSTLLLTEYWRTWLQSRHIPTGKTTIIPNCILSSDLAPKRSSKLRLEGAPSILSVGRLDPVKRIGDVIRAIAKPQLQDAVIHVVGKGIQREQLESLASDLNVKGRVIFYGFVKDEDAARMMDQSDVFVLASEQEGLPTVLLEALLRKSMVVCSRIPGNQVIVDVAGIDSMFSVGNVDELAYQLLESGRTSVTDTMVDALRRTFTWESRASDILAVYNRSIKAARG